MNSNSFSYVVNDDKKFKNVNLINENKCKELEAKKFKMIDDCQPMVETKAKFKTQYSGVIRELEEVNKKRISFFDFGKSYSPIKMEKLNTSSIKPTSKVIGSRKCYTVSPKKNTAVKLSQDYYNSIEMQDEVGEEVLVKNIQENKDKRHFCYDFTNESVDSSAFYDVIEYDCSKDFYQHKSDTSYSLIRVRNEKKYYLNEIPYIYVSNYNTNKTSSRKKFKKLRFSENVEVIESPKHVVKNFIKKLKLLFFK